MRKFMLLAALGIAIAFSSNALAAETRFATASATVTADGDLRVRWNERGLEVGAEVDYAVTANALAAYACQNTGGQFPGDTLTTTEVQPLEATLSLSTGQRTNIRAAVELPAPESELVCPGGQTVTLVCVRYSQIRLVDETNGIKRRLGVQVQRFFADEFPDACL